MSAKRSNSSDNSIKQFNLQTLKRIDPQIQNIIVSGGHVAAYSFDINSHKWVSFFICILLLKIKEHIAVNGPLFLVER
jgi:hypothetical protein